MNSETKVFFISVLLTSFIWGVYYTSELNKILEKHEKEKFSLKEEIEYLKKILKKKLNNNQPAIGFSDGRFN